MSHFQECYKAVIIFVSWFYLLLSSGCSSEYFVDKGHVDAIDGVAFEIKSPYLNEKKAFKLRHENLSPWQLQQIAEAMPAIAEFTNAVLANNTRSSAAIQLNPKVRSIRQLQHIDQHTFLAVKTLQSWQVIEGQIQFTTDYFYTGPDGHFVFFRDNYVFQKHQQKWAFERHAQAQAEGLLQCEKNKQGWRQCQPLSLVN